MAQVVEQSRQVKIGDYTLTGKIGQGGIAEIFKARQESLSRDVAIKILSPELTSDPDIVRRFENESVVIARLNHPNIVHVIDRGKAGNRYYFVMEFIDGTSMREVIDSDKIPVRVKLEMAAQVCKALDYAHRNGVIHRDIKPANILIDRQGNPRVADFGIAQLVGRPDTEMTSSDVIMGTVSYMSPEQKLSSTHVDQTTDIYALGIILYEIMAGKKPSVPFKMPTEVNPALDPACDDIIERCLAEEPGERYQTAVELKDSLMEAVRRMEAGTTQPPRSLPTETSDSFVGKCRYIDTIKETKYSSTILVEQKVTGRLYVIKKHRKVDAGRKEAKLLTTLKHENIINVYGAGGSDRSTVVICEYAQGGSLADRMVRKHQWRPAFDTMMRIAEGLDFAHKNNIVHGNIRPSNILFDKDEVPKLSDFGMPPHYDTPNKDNWYGPPERKVSRQGDIYGLGVILHRMITGRNPQHDSGGNLYLDDVRLMIPQDVRALLVKMLAIRVSYRYKAVEELLDDWEALLRSESERSQALTAETAVKQPERKGLPNEVIIGLVGLVVAVIIVLLWAFKII